MSPALGLHFAGVFLSYFLQVAAAYAVCCLLDRLLRRPQQRFLLWMSFLIGAGAYWLGLIWSEVRGFASPETAGALPPDNATVLTRAFHVPLSWSPGILMGTRIAVLAYISGVLVLAGVATWRHLGLRLLLRRATEPSEPLARLFQETCRDFRISHSRLLVLPGLRSPATACWWRPRILLPEVCEELGPTPQLADVLYHELVHVVRRDFLWAGLSDLICRILFFHPAAWLAGKKLRLQRELACDLAVVEARPGHRADYADSLAYFVRLGMLEEGLSVGVDFAASASTLGRRIRTILAAPQPLPWWKATSRMAAGVALVAAAGALSPALKILLDFTSSAPVEAASVAQSHAPAAAARHRSARRAQNAGLSAQPEAQPPDQDSLTSLRVRPVRGKPDDALTADSQADDEPSQPNARAWYGAGSRPRTVTSVLVTTASQIPVTRIPRDRDRDHDGH